MRAVIQRVSRASVSWENNNHNTIGRGMLVLLGIGRGDSDEDISWLVKKISLLRIFDDEAGVMNLSISDAGGEIMVISQFTLHASTRKGNRPSFIRAASPTEAIPLYSSFITSLSDCIDSTIQTGEFGAYMKVDLVNDGPVTIIIDSKIRE